MKLFKIATLLSALTLAVGGLCAKPIPGPKGGRIVTADAPHVEFFVEKDRTVAITFYDAALKVIALGAQVISVVAEAKSGKVQLTLEKTATGFSSKQPLPEGDDYTVVVQVRDSAGAKPKNYRVLFHDEICRECKRAEYACSCDTAGGAGHKH
ncbi:MAG: hypothetical protein NTV51_08420 [Verrucomicrobia bacterium]|nr:hypothetical protein [Verrucomicrobiota bacterium]